jgi:hypothetical protein
MVPNPTLTTYILEVILFAKNMAAAITNGWILNHLTKHRSDYHQLTQNLEIHNSRPVISGYKLDNKLPTRRKHT